MVVTHNIAAMNGSRQIKSISKRQTGSMEKLSSGYRINRAADDAAGLSISEKMRYQIRGLNRASDNAGDGISLIQTAEGALNEVHSLLQRMNELATQAANDTNTSTDRSAIQLEIDSLVSEIDRISSTTQFNTMNLLDGSFSGKNLQVGALSGQNIEISIENTDAAALNLAEKTEEYTIGTDEPATAVSSNPSLSVNIVNDANVPDKTLFYGSYFPESTRIPLNGSGLNGTSVYLNQTGANAVDGESPSPVFFYLTEGTEYRTTPTPVLTIPSSGWYQLSQRNGAPLTDKNLIGGWNVSETIKDVSSYFDAASGTPANKASAWATPAQLSSAKISGWTERSGNSASGSVINSYDNSALSSALGISVSGTPNTGDSITLTAAMAAGTYTRIIEGLKVDSFSHAGEAMERIQDAIDIVSSRRAKLGAIQNRLEHTILNVDNTSENTQAAESRIRDTNMAKEMLSFMTSDILMKSSEAMLTQANQTPQSVLSLLS